MTIPPSAPNPYASNPNDPNPYAANPYAPSPIPPVAPTQDFSNAIYQRGNVLLVHKHAVFPDRCVKTNEPTNKRLKRTLYWHHPAVYLAILLNVIVYIILAVVLRKMVVLKVPVTQKVKNRRIAWIFAGWGSFLLAFVILIASLSFAKPQGDPLIPIGVTTFFLLLLASALIGVFGCRVVYAKKIDDHFVWLGGTGKDFRESFPEWPY